MEARKPSVESLLRDLSFQRWAIGTTGDEERRRWDRWIRQRAGRREVAREAARIIQLARFKPSDASEGIDKTEIDAAWERLQRKRRRQDRRIARREQASPGQISPEQAPRGPSPRKRRRERQPPRPRRLPAAARTWRRRAAAALLVVALVGVGLWWTGALADWGAAPDKTMVRTAYNERVSLTLPGGTAITLNANSRLHLFVGEGGAPGRAVYLDGEAFFEVARVEGSRGARPFLVHTEDGTVRVLGTRFSVARREGQTRVALNEGKVTVRARRHARATAPASPSESVENESAENEAAENEAVVTLRPGQLAAFGPAREAIRVQEVNPEVYSSWTTGTLIFDETPVATIAERIEHTYGLEVRAEDPSVLRETVSGQVENDLSVFISGLSHLLGRPVRRTGDVIVIGSSP